VIVRLTSKATPIIAAEDARKIIAAEAKQAASNAGPGGPTNRPPMIATDASATALACHQRRRMALTSTNGR